MARAGKKLPGPEPELLDLAARRQGEGKDSAS